MEIGLTKYQLCWSTTVYRAEKRPKITRNNRRSTKPIILHNKHHNLAHHITSTSTW